MKPDYALQYGRIEQTHWWFRARRIILRTLINRYVEWTDDSSVLEVGVGPGENLRRLYPAGVKRYGLEPDAGNARLASERSGCPVHVGVIEALPAELATRRYSVITLFDVLEHIQDDRGALRIIHERLTDEGWLFLSVPAYMWMWGRQDVVNLHCRRYRRSRLRRLVEEAGFDVHRATYFNSFLFPPIALFRLLAGDRPAQDENRSDFDVSTPGLNSILFLLFAAESLWLRALNFPFGVSIFLAARRRQASGHRSSLK